MGGRRVLVIAVVALAISGLTAPAGAGPLPENGDPALVTFAGPRSSFTPTGASGQFRLSLPEVFPDAAYSRRPRRLGTPVPFPWARPLVDAEGIEAIVRIPDAAEDEDTVAVELTETTVAEDGGYSALATVVDAVEHPLLDRKARRIDENPPAIGDHTEITVADADGHGAGRPGGRR